MKIPSSPSSSSVAISALLLLTAGSSSMANRYPEKEIHPEPDTHIWHQETFQAGWWNDIYVTSEFPVSSLRYNDQTYLEGGTPMYEDELVVVVKSDCTQEEVYEQYGTIQVTESTNSDGLTGLDIYMDAVTSSSSSFNDTTTAVSRSINVTTSSTVDVDDLSFLPISTFAASWSYTSFWCPSYPQEEPEVGAYTKVQYEREFDENSSRGTKTSANSPLTTILLALAVSALTGMFGLWGIDGPGRGGRVSLFITMALISAAVLVTSQNPSDVDMDLDDNRELSTTTNKMCKINVELLHDGCRSTSLWVAAPAIRMADVQLQNEQRTTKECTTYYKADLAFPTFTSIDAANTENATELAQLPGQECFRAVEGRPFVDRQGKQIQADVTTREKSELGTAARNTNGWSGSCDGPTNDNKDDNHHNGNPQRKALGQQWAQRALGEHASVSSFAAFTMALMANNAPPALVQDSLAAASDEVRHAKVAFEMASLFLGQVVEPTALPASSHTFDYNLTALALATAREGCIDETLSALLLAVEVDQLEKQQQQEHIDVGAVSQAERDNLKQSMTTIALEEARHSALAWRTIQWICATDAQACEAVRSTVLAPAQAEAAVQSRLQRTTDVLMTAATTTETLQQAWSLVYGSLMPYATQNVPLVGADAAALDHGAENMPLTTLVPRTIIEVVGSASAATHTIMETN